MSLVASGGWRVQDANGEGDRDGDAELKRMYAIEQMRGRGLARRILAALEEDARAAGRVRMVLETGAFHVLLDWSPEKITWSVDGTTYQTRTPADLGGKEGSTTTRSS
ncbi:hypothetical protein SALBM217S_09030 [Streptomyces griseoloalbus]